MEVSAINECYNEWCSTKCPGRIQTTEATPNNDNSLLPLHGILLGFQLANADIAVPHRSALGPGWKRRHVSLQAIPGDYRHDRSSGLDLRGQQRLGLFGCRPAAHVDRSADQVVDALERGPAPLG